MNEIGKNLRYLRNEKGLSIRALAEHVGISHNTLAQYERYEVVPTITSAMKICEYFQVPIEYLVYGKSVVADFDDLVLLRLSKKIDGFSEIDRGVAKKFLKKLIKNTKERFEIEEEIK